VQEQELGARQPPIILRDSTSDLRCCQPHDRLFPQSFVGARYNCPACPERSRRERSRNGSCPRACSATPERAIRTPVISSGAGRIFLPLRSCEGSACAARNLSALCLPPQRPKVVPAGGPSSHCAKGAQNRASAPADGIPTRPRLIRLSSS